MAQSYRRVLTVRRRLYTFGHNGFTIPARNGWPLLGIAYFFALMAVMFLAGLHPIIAVLVDGLRWPVRYFVVPGMGAFGMWRWRPDGQECHLWLISVALWAIRSKRRDAAGPVEEHGERRVRKGRVRVEYEAERP